VKFLFVQLTTAEHQTGPLRKVTTQTVNRRHCYVTMSLHRLRDTTYQDHLRFLKLKKPGGHAASCKVLNVKQSVSTPCQTQVDLQDTGVDQLNTRALLTQCTWKFCCIAKIPFSCLCMQLKLILLQRLVAHVPINLGSIPSRRVQVTTPRDGDKQLNPSAKFLNLGNRSHINTTHLQRFNSRPSHVEDSKDRDFSSSTWY